MKPFLCVLILLSAGFISGCNAEQSAPLVSSSEVSEHASQVTPDTFSGWETFNDLSGERIDFSGTDVKSINLDYAVGWNLEQQEYQKFRPGDQVGGFQVVSVESNYLIEQKADDETPSLICNRNGYQVHCGKSLSGILLADQNGLCFYPNFNETGDHFLFVCESTEEAKQLFSQRSYLQITPKQVVRVQPIPFYITYEQGQAFYDRISEVLGINAMDTSAFAALSEPHYFTATIKFSEIVFFPSSDGEGAGLFGTKAIGYYDATSDICTIEKLDSR